MNKKIIIGILLSLLLMLVVLTGCGNTENIQSSSESGNVNNNSSDVQIGDYIAYNTGTGNTYTAKAETTGYDKGQIFETTGEEKWRVLSIEDDGTINLISAKPITTKFEKGFFLKDKQGFENGVKELNAISEIYGKGEFAESARSMKMEDINQYLDVDEVGRFYQNEYEVDLSEYSGQDKWNKIYELMNADYGKEYTLNSSTRKVSFAFDWYSRENIDLREVIKDQNVINVLQVNADEDKQNKIILADEIVKLGKYAQEPSYFILGLGFYRVSDSSSTYGMETLGDENSEDAPNNVVYRANETFIRPVVTLKNNVRIDRGTGTEEDPFTLK